MGTCYSRQGELHGKESLPLNPDTDSTTTNAMPHPTLSAAGKASCNEKPSTYHTSTRGGFGFKRPASYQQPKPSKNCNEQSDRDSERTTLGTISAKPDGDNKKKGYSSGRFGFRGMGRNRDKNTRKAQLPISPSTDSVQSEISHGNDLEVQRPGRSGSLPSKQSSLKRAYVPRSNTGSWRMIDDTSSVYSGLSGRQSDKKSEATVTGQSEDMSISNSRSSTPIKSAAAVAIKAPIAQMESMETLPRGSVDHGKTLGRSQNKRNGHHTQLQKGQSQLRGPLKNSQHANGGAPNNGSPQGSGHGNTRHDNRAITDQAKNKKPNSFLKKGFLRNRKSSTDESRCESPVTGRLQSAKEDSSAEKSSSSVIDEKSVDELKVSKGIVTTNQAIDPHPDVTDNVSAGCSHSEDLTGDELNQTSIDLKEEKTSVAPVVEKGRPRSRSRSGSRSQSFERWPTGGTGTVERRDKLKKGQDSIGSLTSPGDCEPLDELAVLVEASGVTAGGAPQSRRRERFQRATRPVSFPGPGQRSRGNSVTMATTPEGIQSETSVSMRPPRLGSVCQDEDDVITMDGFTYRHLIQDVTTFKTMLLKLKRIIQEDEFQGQNWKNGFKVSSSQPTSPFDETTKFSFATALLESEDNFGSRNNVEEIMKENVELKRQNVNLQHQVEEQERTISLLQQQMTKYECGYSEPGGKAFTHSATQTDKMSGFYKNTGSYRTACVRRTSSASSHQGAAVPRYRTEFRPSIWSMSTTANDEVFLEEMSEFDGDEDLDLLMEEVSLGSDLDSVGDAASLSGRRSQRRSSATSTAHSAREASLSLSGRESSLSRCGRESSLSQFSREYGDSMHSRSDTAIKENTYGLYSREGSDYVPSSQSSRRSSRSDRPRSLFGQDRSISRGSSRDATESNMSSFDQRASMRWNNTPVLEDDTPDSVFGDRTIVTQPPGCLPSDRSTAHSPNLSPDGSVECSDSSAVNSTSAHFSGRSPDVSVSPSPMSCTPDGSTDERSPLRQSPEGSAATSMPSHSLEGGTESLVLRTDLGDSWRSDSIKSGGTGYTSARSPTAGSESPRSEIASNVEKLGEQIFDIKSRCGSVTSDTNSVTNRSDSDKSEKVSSYGRSDIERSDAESGFGTGEKEEMSVLCETLADNLSATRQDVENNNSSVCPLSDRTNIDTNQKHVLSRQARVSEITSRLSKQHTVASAAMASRGYQVTNRLGGPRYQRRKVPIVCHTVTQDRPSVYLRPPATSHASGQHTMAHDRLSRKSPIPHPSHPRRNTPSPISKTPVSTPHRANHSPRKTPSPDARTATSPSSKSPIRNSPSPSSDRRRQLPNVPKVVQSGSMSQTNTGVSHTSAVPVSSLPGSSRLPRPGSVKGRPGMTSVTMATSDNQNPRGRPHRYT